MHLINKLIAKQDLTPEDESATQKMFCHTQYTRAVSLIRGHTVYIVEPKK